MKSSVARAEFVLIFQQPKKLPPSLGSWIQWINSERETGVPKFLNFSPSEGTMLGHRQYVHCLSGLCLM